MVLRFFVITFYHDLADTLIEGFLVDQGAHHFALVSSQFKRYTAEVPASEEKRFLAALQDSDMVAKISDGGIVHTLGGNKKKRAAK